MKNNLKLAAAADNYFKVTNQIAVLMKQRDKAADAIKQSLKVTGSHKQERAETEKYKVLVSWCKRAIIPQHVRKAHTRVSVDLRPEWALKRVKAVNQAVASLS